MLLITSAVVTSREPRRTQAAQDHELGLDGTRQRHSVGYSSSTLSMAHGPLLLRSSESRVPGTTDTSRIRHSAALGTPLAQMISFAIRAIPVVILPYGMSERRAAKKSSISKRSFDTTRAQNLRRATE